MAQYKQQIKRTVVWTIKNINKEMMIDPNFNLMSKDFALTLDDNYTEWRIIINVREKDFLAMWLYRVNSTRNDFSLNLTIKIKARVLTDLNRKANALVSNNSWGWNKFIEVEKLFDPSLKYLEDESTLKIVVELELFYPLDVEPQRAIKRRKTYSAHFTDKRFCDFTLKSSDAVEFRCHRIFLAEKSRYFEELFANNTHDEKKTLLYLPQMNSTILRQIIAYIYKEEVDISDIDKCRELLDAAESLCVDGLKQVCEDRLIKELSSVNVLYMFNIADALNAKNLEKSCINIIMNEYDTLKKTPAWNVLHFKSMMKVMDSFANIRNSIEIQTVL